MWDVSERIWVQHLAVNSESSRVFLQRHRQLFEVYMTVVRPYLVGTGNIVKSATYAIGLICALGMSPLAQTLEPDTNGFVVALPGDLEPPPGSRAVRILGRTDEPGVYVMRITFAAGTGTKPHFHDQARYITVIEGTWWVALGPDAVSYKPDEMIPIEAGSFIYEPANGIHYDEARDDPVTVQITGVGPVQTTRLGPSS